MPNDINTTEDLISVNTIADPMPSKRGDGLHRVMPWWRNFLAGSQNRRIFGALITISTLTVGVKVVSMLKEMVAAAWFGRGDGMDAFVIAFTVPSFIINVIAGSFNAALIPVHIDVRQNKGPAAAQRLFSSTVALSLVLLLVMTLCLALLGPAMLPFIGSGFGGEKILVTQRLFYLLLPAIAISGLITNWESALNASERFGIPAMAPAMLPLGTIAVLVLFGPYWGIDALAIGTIAGLVLNICVLGWALRKRGINLLPRWYGWTPEMKRVLNQYIPLVGAAVMMCSTYLVDQAMASLLPAGSVAALNYGNKLPALVLTAGTMALGTAVLPYFSKMVAASDWKGLRHTLMTYSRLILLVTIPATLVGVWLSTPLVRLLFQRGRFTADDVQIVSSVQAMYLLQVPFYTLGILLVRMISSLQANRVLLWNTVVGLTVNIVLDYVLMRVMGVAGIALSRSVVYIASCSVLAVVLYRKLKTVDQMSVSATCR